MGFVFTTLSVELFPDAWAGNIYMSRVYVFRFCRVASNELRSDGICMAIIIKGHSGLSPDIPPVSEYSAAAPNGQFIRSVVALSPCHGAHLTRNPIRI